MYYCSADIFYCIENLTFYALTTYADRQSWKKILKDTDRKTVRRTDRQTDAQIDRQTDCNFHILASEIPRKVKGRKKK